MLWGLAVSYGLAGKASDSPGGRKPASSQQPAAKGSRTQGLAGSPGNITPAFQSHRKYSTAKFLIFCPIARSNISHSARGRVRVANGFQRTDEFV
jgi:hypothetical protein